MIGAVNLSSYLGSWAENVSERKKIALTIECLADACKTIASQLECGALLGSFGASTGRQSGIDKQKEIDVRANDIIVNSLKECPVAAYASEELDAPLIIHAGGDLAVAVDPIDGSSNIDSNITLGTIFSVLPVRAEGRDGSSFLQKGQEQLAAGFAVYGPSTIFVMTVGSGTQIFTLERASGRFIRTAFSVAIPLVTHEFSINSSNYRHWEDCVKIYVDDLLRGKEGPREKDFNMRWTATPVADIFRILVRGGIFLYPGDLREGYTMGRLRLVYEANHLAFIVKQAGGAASTGHGRILD
ncbi:MAG: class 1 fructose-bisphosphatase, partial [Hyphomicrobium sp.]